MTSEDFLIVSMFTGKTVKKWIEAGYDVMRLFAELDEDANALADYLNQAERNKRITD